MTDASRADNYRGVFDTRLGFGEKPAVIVIDFVKAYTTEGAPFHRDWARVDATKPPSFENLLNQAGVHWIA